MIRHFVPLCLVVSLAACQSSSSNRVQFPPSYSVAKVAVIARPHPDLPAERAESIATFDLTSKGYLVPSRSDGALLEGEIAGSQSDFTEDEDVAELGRVMNAEAILVLALTDYKTYKNQAGAVQVSYASMTGRLVDTETSQVVWINNSTYGRDGLLKMVTGTLGRIVGEASDPVDKLMTQVMSGFPERVLNK